jgi:tripartite-type tricarboxylate transporter receptor subunit TctC
MATTRTPARLRAPRDGYTLAVISPASATINPLVDRNVGYDRLNDFTLLSQAVGHPAVVKRKGLNTIEE